MRPNRPGQQNNARIENSFYHGIVVENIDPDGLNRIQVRIISKDSKITDNKKLKWCIGLNPAGFFMLPMIGEHVVVFLRNPMTHQQGRFYMGPIHSDYTSSFESFKTTIEKLEIENNGL